MKDGFFRRTIKRISRWNYMLNLGAYRRWRRFRGDQFYMLAGDCRKCAKCCEEPSIAVGRVLWYLPIIRSWFIWWQRVVNGFVLKRKVREGFVFVFDCTHFDRETRLCDSCDSRPAMCRDYPRLLLQDSDPDFFPECGFRPRHPRAQEMLDELKSQGLSEEKRKELARKLFLR